MKYLLFVFVLTGCAGGGTLPERFTENGVSRVRTQDAIIWAPKAFRACQSELTVRSCP